MDLLDIAILALRLGLVTVLYAFLVVVLRFAARGLRSIDSDSDAVPRLTLRLVVLDAGGSGLSVGQTLEVPEGATIGRARQAEVVIADSSISASHVQLSRAGRTWTVSDLGSTNGTLVNDVPVDGEAPRALATGDVLAMGAVRLRVGQS